MDRERRYLMLSECKHCEECCMEEKEPFCPLRYAYWADTENGGSNFDYPHFTGISEVMARDWAKHGNLEMAFWVADADKKEQGNGKVSYN